MHKHYVKWRDALEPGEEKVLELQIREATIKLQGSNKRGHLSNLASFATGAIEGRPSVSHPPVLQAPSEEETI
jgi:hypothetical protein